jgi:hypothetical protein
MAMYLSPSKEQKCEELYPLESEKAAATCFSPSQERRSQRVTHNKKVKTAERCAHQGHQEETE